MWGKSIVHRKYNLISIKLLFKVIYFFSIILVSFFTLQKFIGNPVYYILFTVCFNALLCFGFRTNQIFFDTFIGIFFWLGFWFKFSIRVAFLDSHFVDPTGLFDFQVEAYNQAMLVSSIGASALLIASFLREKFFFRSHQEVVFYKISKWDLFYKENRVFILFTFIFLVIFVAVSNFKLGIYQRGQSTQTQLPFGLNGIYTWLVTFGMSSIALLLVESDIRLEKKGIYTIILTLFENMCSSISMLSRGMILNASSLLFAIQKINHAKIKTLSFFQKIVIGLTFFLFFVGSVLGVNYLRISTFYNHIKSDEVIETSQTMKVNTGALFIDRWVGIEGVMSVVGYPYKDFQLFNKAWLEKYSDVGTTFYDKEIAKSAWSKIEITKNHFISLPGLLAFFYYPGSLLFLFFSMLGFGFLGAGFEWFFYKFSGGSILISSLLSQVVAYRFAHFGYVPRQSYLLFGTLIVNVLLFFIVDWFIGKMKGRKKNAHH